MSHPFADRDNRTRAARAEAAPEVQTRVTDADRHGVRFVTPQRRHGGPAPRRWQRTRFRVTVAVALLTGAVVAVPHLHVAYESAPARVAVQTTSTLVGVLLTYLLYGRFLRRGRLDDLILAVSFGLGACGNAALLVFLMGDLEAYGLSAWGPATAQLASAIGTAAAALASARVLRVNRHAAIRLSALTCVASVPILVGLIGLLPDLERFAPGSGPSVVALPLFAGSLGLLTVLGISVVANAASAVGYARKADAESDPFAHALSLAFIMGAFTRLNYVASPSLYSDWISMGDAFRLMLSAFILAAVVQEIRGYWEGVSEAATFDERRRMARDLHDGLAQELAFISRRARRGAGGDDAVRQIAAAADRALVESRRAIAALSMPLDERFDVILERTAQDIAGRAGARISMHVDPAVRVEREHAEGLIRIVCEAVQNATRHGRADAITLELLADQGLCLRVHDNGCGFPVAEQTALGRGFGLVSMRERAGALGGVFRIDSDPATGTTVEVRLA
jgi:signal transduction histidine kinase